MRHSPTIRPFVVSVLAALAAAGCDAVSQDAGHGPGRHAEDATRIVLLGTSHFAGSATDETTSEVNDVLSNRRQRELDALAGRLADWGTDGLFLECMPDEQARMDSLYAAYRAGHFHPTAAGERNEIYQLGFRAADRAGLERVRCVDAGGVWLGGRARQVAEEHNPAVLEGLEALHEKRIDEQAYLADHTLREYLLELNSEPALWSNHKAYNYYYARMGSFDGSGMKIHRQGDLGGAAFRVADGVPVAHRERIVRLVRRLEGSVVDAASAADYVVLGDREAVRAESNSEAGADTLSLPDLYALLQRRSETFVGFPDHHVGADLVGEWYKRNLRTYANVWRAVEERDERIVLLIGQGHVWTLRTVFRENPDFEVVPVDEVL